MKKSEIVPLENITGNETEGLPESAPKSYMEQRRAFIEAGRPLTPKKTYYLNKKSPSRKAKEEALAASGIDGAMDAFFASLRPAMTGRCLFCNGTTNKSDDDKFHFSLAHLLPKAVFKSVAMNPDNIIELCFWNESCHTNFDNGKITWEFIKDSKEWDLIKEKLLSVLPMVSQEERKHKLYSKLEKLVYS